MGYQSNRGSLVIASGLFLLVFTLGLAFYYSHEGKKLERRISSNAGRHFGELIVAASREVKSRENYYSNLILSGSVNLTINDLIKNHLLPEGFVLSESYGSVKIRVDTGQFNSRPAAYIIRSQNEKISPNSLSSYMEGAKLAGAQNIFIKGSNVGIENPILSLATEKVFGVTLKQYEIYTSSDIALFINPHALFRKSIPGNSDANKMGTDLTLNGSILNGNNIESTQAQISGDTTTNSLNVDGKLETVGKGNFTTFKVNSSLKGVNVTGQNLTGEALSVNSNTSSGTTEASILNSSLLESPTLTSDQINTDRVDLTNNLLVSDTFITRKITASNATSDKTSSSETFAVKGTTGTLNTGGCTGC